MNVVTTRLDDVDDNDDDAMTTTGHRNEDRARF